MYVEAFSGKPLFNVTFVTIFMFCKGGSKKDFDFYQIKEQRINQSCKISHKEDKECIVVMTTTTAEVCKSLRKFHIRKV